MRPRGLDERWRIRRLNLRHSLGCQRSRQGQQTQSRCTQGTGFPVPVLQAGGLGAISRSVKRASAIATTGNLGHEQARTRRKAEPVTGRSASHQSGWRFVKKALLGSSGDCVPLGWRFIPNT